MRILVIAALLAVTSAAQKWPNANVPLPAGIFKVSEGHCPGYLDGGPCTNPAVNQIYLGRTRGSWRRYLLAHEIGHLYDYRHLDNAERRTFNLYVYGRPHRWTTNRAVRGNDGAEEMFAEEYGACLRGGEQTFGACPLIASFK